MLEPSALSLFSLHAMALVKTQGGTRFFLWTCVPPLHKAETSNHLHLWIFKHFKLTTLMHKQSRKQNLTPEKEKDDTSSNMLILMEQHHNAVCRIWLPTFRMLAMMHLPQFLC